MRTTRFTALVLSLALGAITAFAGRVTVTNVTAVQRPNAPIVDIYYDLLNPSGGLHSVATEVSTNSGATYSLTCTNFSGAAGAGISTGMHKQVVWFAADDLVAMSTTCARVRVTATETQAEMNDMVLIPAGSFSMGNCMESAEGGSDELPVHTVMVSAIYMDKYEVSNEKMRQVLQWAYDRGKVTASVAQVLLAPSNTPQLLDFGDGECSVTFSNGMFRIKDGKTNHPIVEVTWYGAVAYCNFRSEMEGRMPCYDLNAWTCNWSTTGYRLPTEAEWEKAARGGTPGHRFPWSNADTITHSNANYYSGAFTYLYDISPTRGLHPAFKNGPSPHSSPGGYFAPNGYGLYDMAGNVWEWCEDWYSDNYYGSSPAADPRGPATGSTRVLRGGSWNYFAYLCRAAWRIHSGPDFRPYYAGFRAVRR